MSPSASKDKAWRLEMLFGGKWGHEFVPAFSFLDEERVGSVKVASDQGELLAAPYLFQRLQ